MAVPVAVDVPPVTPGLKVTLGTVAYPAPLLVIVTETTAARAAASTAVAVALVVTPPPVNPTVGGAV